MSPVDPGGRVFFSSVRRSLEEEDEIRLASVGIDIGSSTTHLVFSRLLLERLDNRYVVSEREVIYESEVLLTPYADDLTIDAAALGVFIERQYVLARVGRESIDTGAIILTGVAMRRANARAIGELFAADAGKFVSVSAGDALETTLAAFGSGAAARSIRESARVMNIDIGGGTSKIAVCDAGEVSDLTVVDVGARIVSFDDEGRVNRVEEAGRRFAAEAGIELITGQVPEAEGMRRMVSNMADCLFEAVSGALVGARTSALLRLDPLQNERQPDVVTFSGGVAEYIYRREKRGFGDLGGALADAILKRVKEWGPRVEQPEQGIRATVVGASQYTVQVSGSTIFVAPQSVLQPARISAAIRRALARFDLDDGERAVALCYRWRGSATFARLDQFCRGVLAGVSAILVRGLPLVMVGDGDIGGLVGIHCDQANNGANPIVSIDGIVLNEFDFIDVGAMLETSGAVPVVIKSLVFPGSAALGRSEGLEKA